MGAVWEQLEEGGRGMLELGRGEELTQCGPSGQDLLAGSSTLDHDILCWWYSELDHVSITLSHTRSLGALLAPTSSLRPFGSA